MTVLAKTDGRVGPKVLVSWSMEGSRRESYLGELGALRQTQKVEGQ